MFTVIIPVYNAEETILTCLSSLQKQTFKDFEVIIIDDGSIDSSGRICDEFAKQDSRFIVFHKKNEGVSSARNYGILHAKGEYITFVDSDDYIDLLLLENYYSIIKNKKVDIIVNDKYYSVSNKRINLIEYKINKYEKISPKDMISLLIKYDYPSGLCMSCYRSAIFKTCLLDETIYFYEDLDLQLRICSNVENIYVNHNPGYYYRSGSSTHSKMTEKTLSCYKIIDKIKKNNYIKLTDFELNQIESNFIISNALIGAVDINHDSILDIFLKKRAKELIKRNYFKGKYKRPYCWIRLIAYSPYLYYFLYRIKHQIKWR